MQGSLYYALGFVSGLVACVSNSNLIKAGIAMQLVKNPFCQSFAHLCRLGLGQHVGQVVLAGHIADPAHIQGRSLPDIMVGDGVGLLLQLTCRVAAVVDHRHVVSLDNTVVLPSNGNPIM